MTIMTREQRIARANEIFAWLDGRKGREREQDERDNAIELTRMANRQRRAAS